MSPTDVEMPKLTARDHLHGLIAFFVMWPVVWVPIFLFCPWH